MTADSTHSSTPRISHELRTPMNHIIGYSELLIEDADDQQLELLSQQLRQVRVFGKELLAVLNDTFSTLHAEPQLIRLRQAREQLIAQASQIGDAIVDVQEQVRDQGNESFLPDLRKIEVAVENFVTMVDHFTSSEAVEDEAAPASEFEPGVVATSNLQAQGHAEQLLVVDDNAENRDVLATMLERQGYTVMLAEGGVQALGLLEQAPTFDLILLDIMMPEVDGFQVLQQIKGDSRLAHIPVIVISALDDLSDSVRCIELGAEDYLSKPFNAVLLRARIGVSLEKKRLRDQELAYMKEVARLTYAAEAIETETYEPDSLVDLGARPDALGHLARVFMHMAHEVYEREARLKQLQQQMLVIELDTDKQATEVNTIVSTPYFQQLKQVRNSRTDSASS